MPFLHASLSGPKKYISGVKFVYQFESAGASGAYYTLRAEGAVGRRRACTQNAGDAHFENRFGRETCMFCFKKTKAGGLTNMFSSMGLGTDRLNTTYPLPPDHHPKKPVAEPALRQSTADIIFKSLVSITGAAPFIHPRCSCLFLDPRLLGRSVRKTRLMGSQSNPRLESILHSVSPPNQRLYSRLWFGWGI